MTAGGEVRPWDANWDLPAMVDLAARMRPDWDRETTGDALAVLMGARCPARRAIVALAQEIADPHGRPLTLRLLAGEITRPAHPGSVKAAEHAATTQAGAALARELLDTPRAGTPDETWEVSP